LKSLQNINITSQAIEVAKTSPRLLVYYAELVSDLVDDLPLSETSSRLTRGTEELLHFSNDFQKSRLIISEENEPKAKIFKKVRQNLIS